MADEKYCSVYAREVKSKREGFQTVAELIETLKKYPQDALVCASHDRQIGEYTWTTEYCSIDIEEEHVILLEPNTDNVL